MSDADRALGLVAREGQRVVQRAMNTLKQMADFMPDAPLLFDDYTTLYGTPDIHMRLQIWAGGQPRTELEAIVRELGEMDPLDDDGTYCWFCSGEPDWPAYEAADDDRPFSKFLIHTDDCLWLRARRLMGVD